MDAAGELLKRIPKSYYIPLGIGCISLILFISGVWIMGQASQSREKFNFQQFSQASSSATLGTSSEATIAVDIEGVVVRPGVYKISQNSRIQDGLVAAGGMGSNADRDYVATHINLAAKMIDGGKIYIPRLGEIVQASSGVSTGVISDQNQQIDINSATSEQLDSLKGVGPVTAQKIISARPYGTVADLLTHKVISQKIYDEIKDSIVAN